MSHHYTRNKGAAAAATRGRAKALTREINEEEILAAAAAAAGAAAEEVVAEFGGDTQALNAAAAARSSHAAEAASSSSLKPPPPPPEKNSINAYTYTAARLDYAQKKPTQVYCPLWLTYALFDGKAPTVKACRVFHGTYGALRRHVEGQHHAPCPFLDDNSTP